MTSTLLRATYIVNNVDISTAGNKNRNTLVLSPLGSHHQSCIANLLAYRSVIEIYNQNWSHSKSTAHTRLTASMRAPLATIMETSSWCPPMTASIRAVKPSCSTNNPQPVKSQRESANEQSNLICQVDISTTAYQF